MEYKDLEETKAMTVKEMIAILQKLPMEAELFIPSSAGYESFPVSGVEDYWGDEKQYVIESEYLDWFFFK